MNIVVFEDAGVEKLFPITTGRPAYTITCASYRLVDWLVELDGNLVGLVRDYLEMIQLNDFPVFRESLDSRWKWTLIVNARIAPTASNIRRLQRLMGMEELNESAATIVRSGWAIAAAIVPTQQLIDQPKSQWPRFIEELATQPDTVSSENGFVLFDYPHQVIDQNIKAFEENIAHRIGVGNYEERFDNVFLGAGVQINDLVVFDSKPGPIVIDSNVKIGPFCFLRGPVYVGPNTRAVPAGVKYGII